MKAVYINKYGSPDVSEIGKVKPLIDKTYPLEDAHEVHRYRDTD